MQHCFFLLVMFTTTASFAVQFDHLTVDDGLSSNHVFCIHQDSLGFMWFGTTRGLNRWNGTDFRIFRHDPLDSNSLSNDEVKCIFQDDSRYLWIATTNGLNKLNQETEQLTPYFFNDDSASSNFIVSAR